MMSHGILKVQSILRVNPGIVMRQGLLGLNCFMMIRDIVRVQCILSNIKTCINCDEETV